MAFRELVEGDCSRPSQLMNLASHFLIDRGHREEDLHRGYRQDGDFANSDSEQMVQQFLGETLGNSPQTFRMDSLLREMREIESSGSLHAPVQAPGVAALATADPTSLAAEDFVWAEQYLESGRHFEEQPHEEIWNVVMEKSSVPPNEEVFELGFGPKWAKEYLEANNEQNIDVDENWIQNFEAGNNDQTELQETAKHLINSVNDPELHSSKFMKFMQQVGNGEVTIESGRLERLVPDDNHDTTACLVDEYINTSEAKLENTQAASSTAAGEDSLSSKEITEDDSSVVSFDLWSKLQEEWDRILRSSQHELPWVSEFSDYYDPYKEYPFETNNPMEGEANALEEGKKRLKAGDLVGAVLCFEAAVKVDESNSEAWQLLGISQAENEQDPQAIAALRTCLSIDPGNLKALMSLAISYTNESYPYQACHYLREWLKHNPEYSHLVPEKADSQSKRLPNTFMSGDIHKEVQDAYIAAARLHPRENINPDVQCGLGVLFNLSREYDKAVDCFKAALQVRPNDSRIWNRLGATLANGDRSEEAVDAYSHALALSPGYIRARYNLGITCLNLFAHREAVEHFLTALNQQAQAKGIGGNSTASMSDSIWGTLRHVVSLLNLQDLHRDIDERNLAKLNEVFQMN